MRVERLQSGVTDVLHGPLDTFVASLTEGALDVA